MNTGGAYATMCSLYFVIVVATTTSYVVNI